MCKTKIYSQCDSNLEENKDINIKKKNYFGSSY